MKIAKISLAVLALALMAASAFAKNARFDGSQYSISLDYNDSVAPGDPVFIRMRFENVKAKKKSFSPAARRGQGYRLKRLLRDFKKGLA